MRRKVYVAAALLALIVAMRETQRAGRSRRLTGRDEGHGDGQCEDSSVFWDRLEFRSGSELQSGGGLAAV